MDNAREALGETSTEIAILTSLSLDLISLQRKVTSQRSFCTIGLA